MSSVSRLAVWPCGVYHSRAYRRMSFTHLTSLHFPQPQAAWPLVNFRHVPSPPLSPNCKAVLLRSNQVFEETMQSNGVTVNGADDRN